MSAESDTASSFLPTRLMFSSVCLNACVEPHANAARERCHEPSRLHQSSNTICVSAGTHVFGVIVLVNYSCILISVIKLKTTANTDYLKRIQMVEMLRTIWHSTAIQFGKCNYMVFSLLASDDYVPSTELKQDSQSQSGRKERWTSNNICFVETLCK